MAALDEFLKPEVEKDIMEFYGELQTVWKIPGTHFIPPNGDKRADDFPTDKEEVGRKAQQILDAGFTFSWEVLRMVNKMAFYIVGPAQYSPDEAPEEEDVAIFISGPGRACVDKVNEGILAFSIPKDGIVRRY